MRRIHIIALLLILFVAILAAVKLDPFSRFFSAREPDDGSRSSESEPEGDIRTATLAAVGGLYPHLAVLEENRQGEGEYDFWPAFEYIAPHFQKADLAMLTLETMQAGPDIDLWGVSGYTGHTVRTILTFNAPIELSHALKKAGINFYSLADNHCMDRGVEGLHATLNNVRALGFNTTGAYLNREERDAVDIVELNGIKVAFVAYTYWTNGIDVPAGDEYAVNIAPSLYPPFGEGDTRSIIADIEKARASGADLVAVVPHWGEQYTDRPFERQREIAREMARAGADMIIGGHPKLVQPCEWIELPGDDGGTRSVPVIYSLGNFYTDQHYPSCSTDLVEYGMLLNLELSKDMDSGRAWISGVDYDIHWCYREWRHRMLVLSDVFEQGPDKFNLSQSQLERLKKRYRENVEIIEGYGFSENKPAYMKK